MRADDIESLIEQRARLDRRIAHLRRVAARSRAETKQHLQPEGEFAGLWVRTVTALEAGGFQTRAQLAAHYRREGWAGLCRIRGLGKYMTAEVEAWLENFPRLQGHEGLQG